MRSKTARGLMIGLLTMSSGTGMWAQEMPAMSAPGTTQQAPSGSPVPAAGGQQMQMGGMTAVGQGPVKRAQAEPSTSLTLVVEGRSKNLTVKDLEAMPQRTVTVQNGHTNAQETYTGVAVADLLASMGVNLQVPGVHGRILRSYLRATGTDFYFVLFSATELMPAMHTGDVIVATRRDGKPLGDAGALMMISSDDKMPARWVHNLTSMTLTSVD